MNPRSLEVQLDTSKLVQQLAELRLLVSQIGFALDNYLLSQQAAATPSGDEPGRTPKSPSKPPTRAEASA